MDHLQEQHDRYTDIEDLSDNLKSLGYTDNEITSAYSWLADRFETTDDSLYSNFPEKHFSNRILTDYERFLFTSEAYGFLIKLLNQNIIDDEQLETILERGAMLSSPPVTEEQIKFIVSSVVFREFNEVDSFENYHFFSIKPDSSQKIH